MGYSYQLVAIPRTRIEALYCSRDDVLFERMRTSADRYVQYLMKIGKSGEEERMRDALRYVLTGGGFEAEPHEIGYAVEACCYELGQAVGAIDTRDVERVEALVGLSLFPGVSECWPIPIPETPDYPLVGTLTVAQLEERATALSAITGVEPESDVGIALHTARDLFLGAASKAIDVIVFLH